jgi:hypothetical protein
MDLIPESQVVRLWQQQIQRCRSLADSVGTPVEVIYPGRLNDQRGGDFRDAVIISGEGCQHGCIEIHTRTSGWVSHGHHRDPGYNQVVLHVALLQDYLGKIRRQDGQVIPTIILQQVQSSGPPSSESHFGLPCLGAGKRFHQPLLEVLLQKEGDLRFKARANHYQKEIEEKGPGQALYQGILEALGYSKNKVPFLRLAALAPLKNVEEILSDESRPQHECLLRLQAFLLGKAGLLPSQRGSDRCDQYISKLEGLWPDISGKTLMSFRDWELFKVRPSNHPLRRIIALSYLIQYYQPKGLVRSLTDLVRAVPVEGSAPELESGFMISADPYGGEGSPLIGRERAAEIVINALLPWGLARSRLEGDRKTAAKIGRIYRRYPRRDSHSLELHMRQQLEIEASLVNSACRQQGLIHVYKTRCIQGRCAKCIFGR